MAISKEAYKYLNEIEIIPNWTTIPDNDERIMKLRVLFDVELPTNKGGKRAKKMTATKNGKTLEFDDVHHCAAFLGTKADRINNIISQGRKYRGYTFERVEE